MVPVYLSGLVSENHEHCNQREAPREDAAREHRLPPQRARDLAHAFCARICFRRIHAETSSATADSLNLFSAHPSHPQRGHPFEQQAPANRPMLGELGISRPAGQKVRGRPAGSRKRVPRMRHATAERDRPGRLIADPGRLR
jgi:hypothetical protein